jgi:hypothetical protein
VARVCTVCVHPERLAIDQALVAGEPNRRIASQRDVSEIAVRRHKAEHLPAEMVKAQAAEEVVQADDLLGQVRELRLRALSILQKAEEKGDLRTALAGIREARACLELLLEVEGEIDRRPTLNLTLAPEWLTVRSALIDVLRPYPEARTAVAARLVALETSA